MPPARENTEIVILPSAIRTTLQDVDLINDFARGVIITLDVTLDAALASITPSISVRDPVSGKFEQIMAMAAVAAVGTHSYIVYPGVAAATESIVEVVGYPLPRRWRFSMAVADADAMTYSVGASYIR